MTCPPSLRLSAARCRAALIVFGLCACAAAHAASAGCFAVKDPQFVRLRPLIDQNAGRALSAVNANLALLPSDAVQTEPRRLAALYAIQAGAYGGLTLVQPMRAVALKGLGLLHDPTDPLRLELLTTYANSFSEPARVTRALTLIAQARAALPRGSRSDLCLEVTQGSMNELRGRPELAIRELTHAYLESSSPSLVVPHMQAAEYLAVVLRGMGDFNEALGLIDQAIQWDVSLGSAVNLSNDVYLQGEILRTMGHSRRAIGSFERARAISVSLADRQGIAYADLRICQSYIALRHFARARSYCERAAPVLTAGKATDMVKLTDALLARIDLGEGRAARALAILNRVLDHDGRDMVSQDVAPAYLARARTNAALGKYRGAYRDLQQYLKRYAAKNRADRVRLQEALEVRFHSKQEIRRNAVLQRKLQVAARHAQRQSQLLHWIGIASIAGTLAMALLSYILLAGRRHRRELLRLANEDNLTGVPNRGHTAQLAKSALESALAHHRPLTVALIDFDHFKDINDRCGHAAGDHVLKEFARLARGALRATDVLGRWGGEEFLLVLPDTTLDTALSSIERLRLLALGICIPASDRPHAISRVTFSAGLATTAEGAGSLDEIVARADAALYEAKNAGRNLVRIDRESGRNPTLGPGQPC